MSGSNCQRDNPLKRNGSDQWNRRLAELSPDYFQVDERTIADFILFARRYSKNVKYYPNEGLADKSWLPFFERDISVVFATLSVLPYEEFLDFKQALEVYLASDHNLDDASLEQYFSLLLHLPLLLLNEISENLDKLPSHDPNRRQIHPWASRQLEDRLLTVQSFLLGAEASFAFTDNPLDADVLNTDPDSTSSKLLLPSQIRTRLTDLNWSDLAAKLFSLLDGLDDALLPLTQADSTPYQQSPPSAANAEKVQDAVNYNLLMDAIEDLISACKTIKDLAATALQDALQSDTHTPHYGLWLTFLKLYQQPQQQLNAFTQRHLDFYYRQVLQIAPKPAQPDSAALVITLAKQVAEHKLAKGTLFKGGKDDSGVGRHYGLVDDFIVNRASISELKSFYLQQDGSQSFAYAAAKVDSLDGIEQPLPKESPQWPAFGFAHLNSQAQVGFAVADSQLLLSDATRTIKLTVTLLAAPTVPVGDAFIASLTTEEGWLPLTSAQLVVKTQQPKVLSFEINLNGEQAAISPYQADIHGSNYATDLPILNIQIKPDSGHFAALKDLQYSDIQLSVGVTGSRNFSISNDYGVLDSSKAFMPFGAQPKANSSFILGGTELFAKPLQSLELVAKWQEPLGQYTHFLKEANADNVNCELAYLQGGAWVSADKSVPLLRNAKADERLVSRLTSNRSIGFDFEEFGARVPNKLKATKPDFLQAVEEGALGQGVVLDSPDTLSSASADSEFFSPDSIGGFVRFTLDADFGHQQYPSELALAMLGQADSFNYSANTDWYNYSGDIPKQPYTPVIAELKVNYQTKANAPGALFHQYPFGTELMDESNQRLFGHFNNQGELYIGLAELKPPQSVSLLFEAVEGSANPLKNPALLQWHYLVDDNWQPIDKHDVSDTSLALTGSGIMAFEVPTDANTEHSILPAGLHWLRLSVAQDTDALVKLLAIHTQAAMVQMVDNNNADNVLDEPLAAGSISKLLVADVAVKSIEQPLPSAQGRRAEAAEDYYQRISERLRHKDRAVAVWDYEQLVLQDFPEVYQVRCLNHTALCRDQQNQILAENGLQPGAVLVVPVPSINPDSASDPRRPYIDTQTLARIDAHLRTRISPFVHLEVQNPKVEEIQLKFSVAFTKEIIDSGYYIKALNQALNQYLMPWAYARDGQVSFGGKWHKSVLINFVEEQPYVDYVKDVCMYHRDNIDSGSTDWQSKDFAVITASSARSVLVSHPEHDISLYPEAS